MHGRALREEINQLLGDHRARIDLARARPLEEAEARRAIDGYGDAIAREIPLVAEELRGLAEGARISYQDAVTLQARRELTGVPEHAAEGDCTLAAYRRRRDDAVVAQTVDVNGNLADFLVVLRVLPEREDDPEMLLLTFAGLLGYLGMNSHGLAIGINLVISPVWGAGVPPYLLVRHLLAQSSVDGCLSELPRIQRSSSRCLTIADRRRLVNVEMTRDEHRVSESPVLCHTNHYLHRELVAAERMNILSQSNSRRRLTHIQRVVSGHLEAVGVEELLDAFVDHEMHPFGVCAHAEGDPRRGESVASVVMEPARSRMHVRPGLPCAASPVQVFEFSQVFAEGGMRCS